jgi:aryl-phospho-beta-D-glucosidase BglC (GH1 family)
MSVPYGLSEGDDFSVHVQGNLRAHYDSSSDGTTSDSVIFIQPTPRIRGVNIGSWFIPERWMDVSFYDGVDTYWSQLCGLVQTEGIDEAERRMRGHLATWFTEKDLDFLHEQGVNSLRLPLGYWNVIADPQKKFVPQNPEVSLEYIDWAFEKAAERGMSIMLDLHGAPGSQNGNDHSGCGYGSVHGEVWNTDDNRELSLRAVEAMAKRYGSK